ncbi:MAG: hypothetical protein A3G70_03465 [Planctomycetes bacterium RIFCSPLOWO2_12_FULL_39_13]|nr:MAG: hypothetical protein A3G70_03465 [Planctomycetes bacterium RIFCSPLOWO2_12_FULL_39_13]
MKDKRSHSVSVLYFVVLMALSALVFPLKVYAVPACPSPFELKQPSGKTFEARQNGFAIHNKVSESKETYLTGHLRTAAVEKIDRTTGKRTCRIIHYLNTEEGKMYRLEDAKGILRKIKPSLRMSIRGDIVDSKVIVEDAKPLDILPAELESSTDTVGEQKTLVALFNYPDKLIQPFSIQNVKDWIINDTRSVDNFFRENSYNKTSLNVDFIDYKMLPNNSTYYTGDGRYGSLLNDSISILDSTVNFRNYARLIFLYADNDVNDIFGKGSIGKWTLSSSGDGDFTASISWINANGPWSGLIAHELGHGFGFQHAASVESPGPYFIPENLLDLTSTSDTTYFSDQGDDSDTMGAASYYNHFSTIWKELASWIDTMQIKEINTSGEYILDQVELPSDGIKALKIPIGKNQDNNDLYYWIEFRENLGVFDSNVGNVVQIRTRPMSKTNWYGEIREAIRFKQLPTVKNKSPVKVNNLDEVISISAGGAHNLSLKSDGTVWAWGGNAYGQLGNGTEKYSSTPLRVKDIKGVIKISAGREHNLALDSSGNTWTWGRNGYGQLGDGTTAINRNTPVLVKNQTGIVSISAGFNHSLALKQDGTVWAWGSNYYGHLGNGTFNNSNVPVQVKNLDGVIAISAGTEYSLVLKSDGTVWAWGSNTDGQLGTENITNWSTNIPTLVENLNGVIAIISGHYHSLALKSDGTIWTWGYNKYGQLGDGTFSSSYVPVQVKNLNGMIAIACGSWHSLGLKSDGTVWAWGDNFDGQLSTTEQSIPIQVNNISKVSAISSKSYNNLAIDSNKAVWEWGSYILSWNGDFLDVDVNKQFHDPYRGVKIKLVEKTGSDSESKAHLKVALSGLKINPSSVLNFDNVLINSSSSQSVTITNTTGGEIKMDAVFIGGTNSELFKIVTDECSDKTLQNGESGRVTISFSPDSEGDKFAILSLPSSDSIRLKATITLYGYGSTESTTTPTPTSTPTPTVTQNPTATPTPVSCDDNYESNDSESKAYGPLTSGSSYEGKICSNSDVDWYKVNITSTGTISLSLTVPSSNDFDLELYDSSDTLISSSSGGVGVNESIQYTATTTGDYYIKVYDFYGSCNPTTPYMLTYSADSTVPVPTLSPIPTQSPLPGSIGRILGYVVDTADNPIELVKLKLKSLTTGAKSVITSDANGYFEFENLDADTYAIVARKNGYKKLKKTVKLEEEESAEITIEMRKTTKRAKGLEESHNAAEPPSKPPALMVVRAPRLTYYDDKRGRLPYQ